MQWKIVPQPEVLVDYYRSLVDRTEGFELEGGGGSASRSSSLGSSDVEESPLQAATAPSSTPATEQRDGDAVMTDGPT